MRIPFFTLTAGLVLTSVATIAEAGPQTVTLEGLRPDACRSYDDITRFMEHKAARKAQTLGYNQFVITGGLGGTRYYSIVMEVLPDGYTARTGKDVHQVREVLAEPRGC